MLVLAAIVLSGYRGRLFVHHSLISICCSCYALQTIGKVIVLLHYGKVRPQTLSIITRSRINRF